jgi:ArsR family transcriptional regulator, virulence genes transcriptional regulator
MSQPFSRPKPATLAKASAFLKLLAHPVRLSLLCNLLLHGELSASALAAAEASRASQSQVAQFLTRMRTEKLIKRRRDGQTVYYQIASPAVAQMITTLANIYCR